MTTVFSQALHIKAIYDNSPDGELTDEQCEQLRLACGSLESYAEHVLEQKIEVKARVAARKARIDQLRAANDADENGVERLAGRLGEAIKLAGLDKIKTAYVSCWFQKTEAVQVECDPACLPKRFIVEKVTYTADKLALKAHFAAGGQLPEGVTIQANESLQIR